MCLLIVVSGVVPGMPLIVAANRDERRARPAIAMTRLDAADGGPAILGGRDEVGGGTWLATNDAGVVAGLTNRPLRDGPDAAKRSRGELPLALARHATAAAAVEAFGSAIDPSAFNPSWLLVADRDDLFFVDVTGTDRVLVEHLDPGVHVLENRGLHEPSPKVERVRELLEPMLACRPTELLAGLRRLLADHHLPTGEPPEESSNPRLALAARAICVHADEDDYGTRSAAVISVADSPGPPTIRWTDDAPCHHGWNTSAYLWPLPTTIDTERTRLVVLSVDEARAITAGVRRPDWHAEFPRQDDVDVAAAIIADDAASGWGPRRIVTTADGLVVGTIGFMGPPVAGPDGVEVEVGYGLVPAARNAGLATEALTAVVAVAERASVRVVAEVAADNGPSRRVLERCGFDLAGTNGDGLLRMRRPNPAPGVSAAGGCGS
jgi:uncharacterized protein with NRDE domain/RimJ/RimL family protein N-acetyltransferase